MTRRQPPPGGSRLEARLRTDAGVTPVLLRTDPRTGTRTYGLQRGEVRSAWLEVPLPDGWLAAYRLVVQDGMPVVAELRVFPHAEGAPRRDKPGQWAGEGLRAEVADLVPPGGLTGTILRRVSLWRHREQLREILAYLEAERGEAALRQALGRPGLERQALAARPRPGGRRRRWSDTDYARIAAAYEQAVAAGSRRPAAEVARTITLPGAARPLTARQVADLAHRARERGLLTYPHKQGASGGRLTDKARALLGLDTSGQPPAAPTPTKARRHGRGK